MTFEEIFNTYWQKIFRMCMGYVNNTDAAKDLAQDTFIIVWNQLPKFRRESGIGTWIYRIATNICLREIEKEKRITKTTLKEDLPEIAEESLEPKIKLLYQFISELPEIDRLIISLELEEVKQAEIADIIGISEGNIRVRIHRIKSILSKKFTNHARE